MFHVPVAFLSYSLEDGLRRVYFHEYASNGAEYMTLCDTMIAKIMEKASFAQTLKKELREEGLRFADAHAPAGPGCDLSCPIQEARAEMLARHKLALLIAASMEVSTITLHIGNYDPAYSEEVQCGCVKRSLDELLPLAEELGLTICIENIWTRLTQADKLLEFKAAFPTDALGFCYDSGHANLMAKGSCSPESEPNLSWAPQTPKWETSTLEKMLPHIVNCHLHDNNGIKDQHRKPGTGNIDWKHVIGLLKKAPRLKVVQSETDPFYNHDSVHDICRKMFELGEL